MQQRVTPLVTSFVTKLEPTTLSSQDLQDDISRQPLAHRRQEIEGTQNEGIILNHTYVLSFKNNSFLNLSLSCLAYEIYKPVGIENSAQQIITCQDISTVLVVSKNSDGEYSVSERIITINGDSSSAGIVTIDGVSTAMYILSDDNLLVSYSLGVGGYEIPFFSTSLETCAKWKVSSYSDSKVVLFCNSSGSVSLVSSDGTLLTPAPITFSNPSSLVYVRNEGMAIEITDYGVKIYLNDFIDSYPIITPSAITQVEYTIVNDIVYFFLVANTNIYIVNCSNPLEDDYIQTIVTEVKTIKFNYVYNSSPFNLLVYTITNSISKVWPVKTIDFITRIEYPLVNQPWFPLLIDIRTESHPVIIIPTSTTATQSSSNIEINTSINTVSTSINININTSTSSVSLTSTSSVAPTNPSVKLTNATLIGAIVIVVMIVALTILFFILLGFVLYCKNSKRQTLSSNNTSQTTINTPMSMEETETGRIQAETGHIQACTETMDMGGGEERV